MNLTGKYTVLFLIAFSFTSRSQSISRHVIASQGDFYNNANGSLSWTIGEISTETYASLPKVITQGFQQPDSLMFTGIEELRNHFEFYVSPNPTQDIVYVITNSEKEFKLKVTDVTGKMVFTRDNCRKSEQIDLSQFISGVYLLVISNEKETIKSRIKCIKID